jgi:hypothetical protein
MMRRRRRDGTTHPKDRCSGLTPVYASMLPTPSWWTASSSNAGWTLTTAPGQRRRSSRGRANSKRHLAEDSFFPATDSFSAAIRSTRAAGGPSVPLIHRRGVPPWSSFSCEKWAWISYPVGLTGTHREALGGLAQREQTAQCQSRVQPAPKSNVEHNDSAGGASASSIVGPSSRSCSSRCFGLGAVAKIRHGSWEDHQVDGEISQFGRPTHNFEETPVVSLGPYSYDPEDDTFIDQEGVSHAR